MKCVCFANLCVSFRHNLDEAMLTDPWDSMKHADLGGFSTPFGSNQFLFCHRFPAVVSGCLLAAQAAQGV